MAEDMDVGTDRLQEEIEQRRREAAGEREEGHGRPRWLDYLAVSTALFAVFAAAAALAAGNYANEALFKANQGVLQQTRAVDAWSEFQADSIKKSQQNTLATLLPHVGGTPAEIKAANDEAARRQGQQNALMQEAKARDAETVALNAESRAQLEHHHRFAVAVTLFQVAIGLAAIAALLRRMVVWYGSVGAGALALLAFINGFALIV